MSDILDEGFVPPKEPDYQKRDILGLILTLLMLVVGTLVIKYTLRSGEYVPWYVLIIVAAVFQFATVALGAIIHLLYKLFIKGKKFRFILRLFIANSVIIGFFFWGFIVFILIFEALSR